MKRGWFILVFVFLIGILFYSQPLVAESVDGKYIVDEFIIVGSGSCTDDVGYEEVSFFVDKDGV